MTLDKGEVMNSFTFYLLSGKLTEPGGGGEPGDAGFQIYFDGENLGWKNWSMATEQRFNGNVTFPFKTNQKYHVAIWVQKQRVRMYANENKVLDVPRAVPIGSKPNIFRFDSRDEAIPLIGNFRIASGFPDMRNSLLKNGKIISYGIQFDVNSDKLKPESYSTLKEISDILKENPDVKILIVGHTDSDGDNALNLDLSKRRGTSVKNELINKFGADATRLETDGKGESEPIADNNSSVNKAKNRRVEFINLKEKSTITGNSASSEENTFKDPRNGKAYKSIKIGNQTWMAENLAFKTDTGCYIYDNSESNLNTYGYLYNWSTAIRVCPTGWHLPSADEFINLAVYLGDKELVTAKTKGIAAYSSNGIAAKLKSKSLWETSDFQATNESGFSALPAGQRTSDSKLTTIGYFTEWWSSTEFRGLGSWYMSIHKGSSGIMIGVSDKKFGNSVRCLKD